MHDDRPLTPRQRIMQLLAGTRLSSYQLAQMLGISERQVEEHLVHIIKTVSRDRARRFLLDPSSCRTCGFEFTERTRVTCPSRCPRCRSESITAPRFGIELRRSDSPSR
jgi:predicted Zn-ribbon and HTH transcriptional regulator